MKRKKKKIVTEDFSKYNCFKKIMLYCSNKLELNSDLFDEREKVFCIAKIDLNYADETHVRILQTVYKNLTSEEGTNFDWESIGFQGNEPKTDLRAAGMFGLLQILYITEKFNEFTREMLTYSRHKSHHFPFVCLLLNFVMITIEAMREGDLIDYCNKSNSVINTMNQFFFGVTHTFFQKYKNEKKNINDIGRMIPQTNSYAKECVKEMLECFHYNYSKQSEMKDSMSLKNKNIN